MKKLYYHDAEFNLKGLSEYTNVPYSTLAWRIEQGWSEWEAVKGIRSDESVREFSETSNRKQYRGMTTNEVFKLYQRWCDKYLYEPVPTQTAFTRQMRNLGWEIERSAEGNRFATEKDWNLGQYGLS